MAKQPYSSPLAARLMKAASGLLKSGESDLVVSTDIGVPLYDPRKTTSEIR